MRKVVTIFKRFFNGSKQANININSHHATIISRENHTISRNGISKAALKVLYRLHKAGFSAYLVGGSVRDLLLGLSPKDFDVATDAHPEQIQRLFRNSIIIGRRFRLVHVHFGDEIIEVATFRGSSQKGSGRVHTQHGQLLRDNVYGTMDDDVWRRDFTVNALYYNIADFSVVDYTNGMKDLKERTLRVIGDPVERYHEDPARMLRALRLAGKLGFAIEKSSADPILEYKHLLTHVPPARLFDKMLKIFHSGKSFATYQLLNHYQVFSVLFPATHQALQNEKYAAFVAEAFKNTDDRINQEKTINSAFLFSILLWGPVQQQKEALMQEGEMSDHQAFNTAMSDVILQQLKLISIPRRFTTVVREIWYLQYHLEKARPKRIYRVFHHQRFRAAYDFLALRCQSKEADLQPLLDWWTTFQESDEELREQLIAERFGKKKNRQRKKKGKANDEHIPSVG